MKIYAGYPVGITKISRDKDFYQTEDLSNVITVYVNKADVTGITYFLSLEFLRADGRKTTISTRDAFAAGDDTTYTEDGVTYDIHNFTLTDTQLAVAGTLAFTCYINILNSGVVEKRGVLFNAISNVRKTVTYSANTIFVVSEDEDDVPIIVTDMKTAIETLAGQLASKVNKADVADNLTTNDSDKVLSAKQGYILKAMLEGLAEIDGGNVDTFKANDFILNGISLKNSLFDYSENVDITNTLTLTNYYLDKANGNANPDSNSRCTDYIDLSTYTGFWISGHSQYATTLICTYDENKTFLRSYGDGTSAGQTFTDYEYIPQSDEKYVRFSTYQYTQYPLKVVSLGVFTPINKEKQDNYLFNKKYVACGDSFTKGDVIASDKVYPYLIAQRNNMRFVNMAHNGSYCHYGENGFTNPNNSYYYQNIPLDADIITIAYGLNETSTTIGTKDSSDNTTIWGAYNEVLGWITTNIPNAKVGIISNDAWMTYDLRNALQEIASYWGVEFLDLKEYGKPFMISGKYSQDGDTNPSVVSQRTNQYCVSNNNGHPNELGHKVRSYIVENFLRGAYGVNNSYTKKEIQTFISALQPLITNSNKLSSDLVDDAGNTNKFVTASEKAQITTNATDIDKLQMEVANLKTAVEGNLYNETNDSGIAYEVALSNPLPYGKVDKVGGMSYKSENLIVIDDVAETERQSFKYKISNGKFYIKKFVDDSTSSNAIINLATPITFIANKTYYLNQFNANNALGIRLLNNNNTTIISLGITANGTFTPTETKVATKIQWFGSGEYNVELVYSPMITENSVTEFKQGFSGIRNTAVSQLIVSANLLKTTIESGAFDNANGTKSSNNKRIRTAEKTSLTAGTYTISFSGVNSVAVYIFDSNDVYKPDDSILSWQDTNSLTFTISYDFKVNFLWRKTTNDVITPSDMTSVLLNRGSTIKPNVVLPIPSEIQALTGWGWGLTQSASDYLYYPNKKYVQAVNRAKAKDLDWTYRADEQKFKSQTISDMKNASVLLCTNYTYDGNNAYDAQTMTDMTIKSHNASPLVYIKDTNYTDATDFKNHFTDDDYIYYELATPIETDVSQYLTDENYDVLPNLEPNGSITLDNTYQQEAVYDITTLEKVSV